MSLPAHNLLKIS